MMMEEEEQEISAGEGEESRGRNHNGGPTKLPRQGGGQKQRPGKEEPLVGKEEGRKQQQHLCKPGWTLI